MAPSEASSGPEESGGGGPPAKSLQPPAVPRGQSEDEEPKSLVQDLSFSLPLRTLPSQLIERARALVISNIKQQRKGSRPVAAPAARLTLRQREAPAGQPGLARQSSGVENWQPLAPLPPERAQALLPAAALCRQFSCHRNPWFDSDVGQEQETRVVVRGVEGSASSGVSSREQSSDGEAGDGRRFRQLLAHGSRRSTDVVLEVETSIACACYRA